MDHRVMTDEAADVDRLIAHIRAQIPEPWTPWPGGRREVEAALIDAVLSIQASYGRAATPTRAATGIPRSIERYAKANPGRLDNLKRLARADAHALATLLGNQQETGNARRRPPSSRPRPTW
jgi:hypothetical protein